MKTSTKLDVIELPITTPEGQFVARYSQEGLAGLDFPKQGKSESLPSAIPARVRQWHETTVAALKRALAGKPAGSLPPLDWSAGTEFQRAVWRAMKNIPCGETQSYGEIARAIGRPKAVRAVGGACGANPIPVLVPCHRVLAAKQKLGGFSGGLEVKRHLLALEGVQPRG